MTAHAFHGVRRLPALVARALGAPALAHAKVYAERPPGVDVKNCKVVGEFDVGLTAVSAWVDGHGDGFRVTTSTEAVLSHDVENNEFFGSSVNQTDQAHVVGNVVSSSGRCDASMTTSTNSVRQSNSFGTICNDVPGSTERAP